MKSSKPIVFLTLLAAFGCQRGVQNGLHYRLSYNATEQKIHVEMQYTPASEDSMTFVYGNPGFGGQLDIFNCVKDLSVSGKHKVVDSLRQLTVYPEGNKPIDIQRSQHVHRRPRNRPPLDWPHVDHRARGPVAWRGLQRLPDLLQPLALRLDVERLV